MPANPQHKGQELAEGSREVIETDLKRTGRHRKVERRGSDEDLGGRQRAPGDEAAPGTPGTGEDVCPECRGSGKVASKPCPNCEGSGRITKAIGGA
jgi:RecJ-like exonuclease